MPGKKHLTVVRSKLSLDEIAKALRVSEKDALEKFKDPRVTSWFAEIWGETLFGYKRHPSSNNPGSDAQIAIGNLGRFEISVRCFNKGAIKFQKSKYIGSGRTATRQHLVDSVNDVERVVVVDISRFPELTLYPIDSKDLLGEIWAGTLTTSGFTPKRFRNWLNTNFEIVAKDINIPIPTPPAGS
jgi:hypothetical protein